LQEFFRVVKEFVRLLGIHSQRSCGQLRRHRRSRHRRIRWNEANLIDVNVGIALQGSFQLLCERSRLGAAAGGKSANKSGQARLRNLGRKVNAGDSGRRKHARETFFRCGCIQRCAVQQQLISGHSQQHAGVVVRTQCRAQFRPRGLVLFGCAGMPEVIHPGKLEQDVQAAHKGASGCGPRVRVSCHWS
jgi:hypothetical protein